ncbi:MAG TPA: hypothetical protein VF665_21150 [Longimicrobium sp.]|jgi:hypothetical protein|uniref:hypothetical protein n=1 Tax=Longimicrobium sp. TaxID=2029185 RepID=UPI002ED8B213
MKHPLLCALVCSAAARTAFAQALPEPRTTVGLAVGPAFTTSWFRAEDQSFRPGASAAVGLVAEQRVTRKVGVRGQVAYTWTGMPESEAVEVEGGINTWLYDLSITYRPLRDRPSPALANGYVFLGGGAVTTNVPGMVTLPGGLGDACFVFPYRPLGACVLLKSVTRPAVTAGIGTDFARLGERAGAFAEYSVHGYASPSLELNDPAEGAFTLTHRLSVGVRARAR